ncbi:MAG: ATP synthase subunit I [Armatimonadetes bacterium]|nr:ATP synthase subunit I [Armatimonadota bacterium]
MPDEKLASRSLKTAVAVALLGLGWGLAAARPDWCWGWMIGSGIGLSSLWSLLYVVPKLVGPGPKKGKFWLGALAVIKLPIYLMLLYYAMTSHSVNPIAVVAGVGVVPGVILLKVLGFMLVEAMNNAPMRRN